jgi:hypothetical protein
MNLTDAVMLLPLRLLVTLKVNLRQKLALAGLFSLGTIVIIFAFVRLFEVTQATAESKTDPTTVAKGPILLSVWSVIEASVAVVVTNLPAFRSLFTTHRNTRSSRSQGPYHSTGYATNEYSDRFRSRTQPMTSGGTIEMHSLQSSDEILVPDNSVRVGGKGWDGVDKTYQE